MIGDRETRRPVRPRWTPPTLTYVSRLDQLVQSATGKVTADVSDSGEPKKNPNQG